MAIRLPTPRVSDTSIGGVSLPDIGGSAGAAWENMKGNIIRGSGRNRASSMGPITRDTSTPAGEYAKVGETVVAGGTPETYERAGERAKNWWDTTVLPEGKAAYEGLKDWWRNTWDQANPDYSDFLDEFNKDITMPGSGTGYGTGSGYGDIYGQQRSFADTLRDRALGRTDSVAELAARQAQDRNLKQSMALAMAQPRSALGQRAALQQQAMGGQPVAADLARARLAEQQQAQDAYASQLGQMAGVASQRDIAQMQDRRARALAVLEAKMRQQDAKAALQQSIIGAGASGIGGIFESVAGMFNKGGGSGGGTEGGGGGTEGGGSSLKLSSGVVPNYTRGKARREL